MGTFLDRIQKPSDLHALSQEEILLLCEEIREYLIHSVTKTGGHLASNLGVVELTVALHSVFDFSKDRLVFDVGHQCYVHKLLTGRKDKFHTLRTLGGLSGFPKPEESFFDAFGTGHSSTSLSAALGIAQALKNQGSDAYTVCVIGDGAFTGGMIHEALNNCAKDLRLILILNENEMSISKNIGRFSEHIAKIRTSEGYYKTKNRTSGLIRRIPLIGSPLFRFLRFIKQSLKNMMYGSNLFEELGLYYLGPVDGHDYKKVRILLEEAVSYGKSAVIHVHTKKGKGYKQAENNPSRYHGVTPSSAPARSGDTFSSRVGDLIKDLGDRDPSVCAVTAAMGQATGLEPFREAFPNRFYDVGIAEAHAVTFCAGLSSIGMKPIFAVYSSFLQRSYDSLIHDVALQHLPLTLCVDRAGLNKGDGPTHHGIFDVAFLSQIPDAVIYAPATFNALENALETSLQSPSICAIRYHNGGEFLNKSCGFYDSDVTPLDPVADFRQSENKSCVIITYGQLFYEAIKAKKRIGPSCGVILLQQLTPYPMIAEKILQLFPNGCKKVLIAEEGIASGGAAMHLSQYLRNTTSLDIRTLAISDPFSPIRQSDSIFDAYGIGADDMIRALVK